MSEAVCCACLRVREVSDAVAKDALRRPGWRCRSCAARGRSVHSGPGRRWRDPVDARPCKAAGCRERFVGRADKDACSDRCSAQLRRDAEHFDGRRGETIGLDERRCAIDGPIAPGKPLHSHHVFAAARDRHDVLVSLHSGCHDLVSELARRRWGEDEYATLIALAEMQRTGEPCAVRVELLR